MFAETLFCQFHQYGHCKFGLKCRKFHTKDTCPNFIRVKKNCSKRHPKQCKLFVLNGRCKFAETCSFPHVSSEEIIKIAMEKELSGSKEDIRYLKQVNTDLENQNHKLNEKLKELEAQKDDLFRIDFVSDDKPENEK